MRRPLNEIRQELTRLTHEARDIWNRHASDGQEHTAEELAQFDQRTNRITELEAEEREAAAIEARGNRINALLARQNESEGRTSDPLPHNDPSNTRNGLHGYSLLKALRQMDPSNKRDALDGLELEVHAELVKRRHVGGHQLGGLLIPWDLPVDRSRAAAFAGATGLERRDLTTTTGTGAVMTTTMPTMIELLRNITLMNKLGARTMADMQGNFNLPRQSGAGTGYWINPESATITKSNQTIDNVAFSPSTLGAQTVYSRAFLHQTSVDAEMFVREDLSLVIGIELDRAGFNGSGSGAEPTGIINNGSVGVVAIGTNGGAPTWASVAECERDVDTANALNGLLNYVTSPKGRYKLKTTVKDSNTAAKYLWNEDEATVNGYPAWSTNQIPTNLTKGTGTNLTALVFGDFTQAVYAFWGGLDTIVNPFTSSNNGAVEITVLQDADFQLRHAGSFAVIKDLDPA